MIRPFAFLIAVALVSCVGDDPKTTNGSSSGTSGTSGASGTVQAGYSADRAIGCNNETECKGGQICCGTGNDWLKVSCQESCGASYKLQCDDRSDCATGNVCCMVTDLGARATNSFCQPSCSAANEQQLCKQGVSGECAKGTCTSLTEFSPNGLAKCK